ncbi:MAG: sulfotransferase domain-containing protein [Rickettsiales bacterium]|nr:sulfotransferase domain-containing protein [Rickettsiales bacterium]
MTHRPKTFPDIFVIGAQKAGTTSLCAILDGIEGLCVARPKEPMVITRDDACLHPHFFAEQSVEWDSLNYEEGPDHFFSHYESAFAHAEEDDAYVDGSTTTLLSLQAIKRIKAINPDAKIIAILRDPAKRAYSAYWHHVKSGTACEGFEKHLRFEGGETLRMGHYAELLQPWLDVFDRKQLHFICYEDMLVHPDQVMKAACSFLGVSAADITEIPRENSANTPRSLRLQLCLNWLNRRLGRELSAIAPEGTRQSHWADDLLNPLQNWNLVDRPYPDMPKALHRRLDQHYTRINAPLEAMTGLDVSSFWYTS